MNDGPTERVALRPFGDTGLTTSVVGFGADHIGDDAYDDAAGVVRRGVLDPAAGDGAGAR